jgi:hypothetical protein
VAALGRARHLDSQNVFVADARQGSDVEGVREEVPLRVAEVGAVEPHVGLVEDAVERHPATPPGVGLGQLVAAPVQQRSVVVREVRMVAPVPGHRDLCPRAVVDLEPDRVATKIVVGRRDTPDPVELHRHTTYVGVPEGTAARDPDRFPSWQRVRRHWVS